MLNLSDSKSINNSSNLNFIHKSVNLNSAFKSSNSKVMNSESFNLQQSSDKSRTRTFSLEQRPTIQKGQLSQIETTGRYQKTLEVQENKFVALNNLPMQSPDIYLSKVSEFRYDYSGNKPTNRDPINRSIKPFDQQLSNMQNKVTVLIDENSKLIEINEQLMIEVEHLKTKFQSQDNVIIINSYQREIQTLKQSIQQYKQINEQQQKQIHQFQNILNEKSEITHEHMEQSSYRNNNQIMELQSQLRIKSEQFTQLAQRFLLKCFEQERQIKQQEEWEQKLMLLLQENENLNQILGERLNEIQHFPKICEQYKQQIADIESQFKQANHLLQQQQVDHQQQLSQYNQTMQQLEIEINSLQTQITEQHYQLSLKSNDQAGLIKELSQKIEEKSQKIHNLEQQHIEQDLKWKNKCTEFEREMKKSYNDKLNTEINLKINKMTTDYQTNVVLWQQQIQSLLIQNDQLKTEQLTIASQLTKYQILEKQHANDSIIQKQQIKQLNDTIQQLTIHKNNDRAEIDILKQQIHQFTEYTNAQYDSNYSSYGFQEKKQMIDENRQLNIKVWRNCQDIMNKRYMS